MDQKLEQAYLYDFYGELLKERQRRIYEDFVFNDLSLGEIAQEEGISRQGVHVVQKFLRTKERVEQIHALASEFRTNQDMAVLDQMEQISNAILEEL